MQILVFKTNLYDAAHVSNIAASLSDHPQIHRWNVDLHDCDRILRIESASMQPNEVEAMLTKAGYHCEVLE